MPREGTRSRGMELQRRPGGGGHEADRLTEVLVHLRQPLDDGFSQALDVGGRLRALVQLERDRQTLLRLLVLCQHEREGLDPLRELRQRVDRFLDVRGRDLAAVVGDGVVGPPIEEQEGEVGTPREVVHREAAPSERAP